MIKTLKIGEWYYRTDSGAPSWGYILNGTIQNKIIQDFYIDYIFEHANQRPGFYSRIIQPDFTFQRLESGTKAYALCCQLYERDKALITQAALTGQVLAQQLIQEMESR